MALNILFGLPLPLGGLIVGLVSMALLAVQSRRGQRPFEFVVMGLLAIITIGFGAGLLVSPVRLVRGRGGRRYAVRGRPDRSARGQHVRRNRQQTRP